MQLVGDGEPVLGKLIKVEADNMATVQVAGGCTLPGGTSATLTHGGEIRHEPTRQTVEAAS